MDNFFFTPKRIARISILIAIMCVSSYIFIPLPFTPVVISALTCSMGLAALLMSPRETFVAIGVYLLLGAVGLPVFSAGRGGIGLLMSPQGGFYFSFLLAYTVESAIKGKTPGFRRYWLAGIACIPLSYAGGVASMMAGLDISFAQAMAISVYPFIIGDIVKCWIAAKLALKLHMRLGKFSV